MDTVLSGFESSLIHVLDHGFVRLLDYMGDDLKVANSARISFNRVSKVFSDRDEKLLGYLAENEHWTPFRHCAITFHIKCPLAIKAQVDKHQVGVVISSVSGRYLDFGDMDFYVPDTFHQQSPDNKQASEGTVDRGVSNTLQGHYLSLCHAAFSGYKRLLESGVAREQARLVLPTATYTEFYMTLSLQALAHFIKLREHAHAQWEIQQYAKAMKDLALPIFPVSLSKLLEVQGA